MVWDFVLFRVLRRFCGVLRGFVCLFLVWFEWENFGVCFYFSSSPFPSSRHFLSSTDLRKARWLWHPGGAPLSGPAAAVCPTLGDGRHRLRAGGESRAETWSSSSNRRCLLSPAPPPPPSSSGADSLLSPRPRSAGAASATRPWGFSAAGRCADIRGRGDAPGESASSPPKLLALLSRRNGGAVGGGIKLSVCLFYIKTGKNKNSSERPPAPRSARRRARRGGAPRGRRPSGFLSGACGSFYCP